MGTRFGSLECDMEVTSQGVFIVWEEIEELCIDGAESEVFQLIELSRFERNKRLKNAGTSIAPSRGSTDAG